MASARFWSRWLYGVRPLRRCRPTWPHSSSDSNAPDRHLSEGRVRAELPLHLVVPLGREHVARCRGAACPCPATAPSLRRFGIALFLGGATHPFIPNHYGQGIGLLVAALGF